MRSTFPSFLFLCLFFFGTTSMDAQSNQYLHLDGEDDFVEIPNAASYVEGATGVSMTGWFYTDELVYGQGMIGIRGGGTDDGEMYVIQLNDGVLECRYISTGGFHEVVGPAGSAQAGTWQHLAWVYSGTEIELFINGVSVGSSNASGTFASVDRPMAIGKSIQSGFNFVFGGRVDEVTLWSKGLSQAEILDMMANELVGDEIGLELYYKMNQGFPGGDNSSITELVSEVGSGSRNGMLMNFSMTGEESNFNGELSSGFQSISFPQVIPKLITDAPFELEAEASSGLPVSYEVISGPATVSGSTMTLDGTAGTVVVRASQAGDMTYSAAADVEISIAVVDPAAVLPIIDLRNPIPGDFYCEDLGPIQLASIVKVWYWQLFQITDITFEVDGETVPVTDHGNTHQTGWWDATSFGEHTFTVTATHSGGTTHSESVVFNITSSVSDLNIPATVDIWADADNFSVEAESILPSYVAAFDEILGYLEIDCPPGGCDPWDRVSSIEVKGHNGEWYEIIRYLTPYGVACEHEIDLTDFMSLLQGKVRFRVNLGTQGNGFLYSLNLEYASGTPDFPYSTVEKLWYQTYDFGNMANLQPTEEFYTTFPGNALNAKMKVVSTGHGWGNNNTGNAAEFHQDVHNFWVNGVETFEQDNWNICNPNPDGCSPQNGTWYFERAGWCPGSIAQFFDYDMTPFIAGTDMDLRYIFDEDYQDFCHPSNPDCVDGATCDNCDDGFNPHLIVTSYLITKGEEPLGETLISLDVEEATIENLDFALYPNPSAGIFEVNMGQMEDAGTITILTQAGRIVERRAFQKGIQRVVIDLGDKAAGIYLIQVETETSIGYRKLVVE